MNKNLFEFVECRHFEHFSPTNKSVRYSGLLLKDSGSETQVVIFQFVF